MLLLLTRTSSTVLNPLRGPIMIICLLVQTEKNYWKDCNDLLCADIHGLQRRNTAVLQASPAGPASHHRQQKPRGIQLPLQTKRDHPNEAAITPGHMIKLNMTPESLLGRF